MSPCLGLGLIFIPSVYVTGTRRINQHLSFHVTVNVSCPSSLAPPPPLAARWPQHSFNQQISTVTLMSEIAYEGNLFPMVGPMINAHWQRVFPPGALLGRGSCMTPPPPRCPLSSWHPRGGEGWSGDAAEGLWRALRDNSLLSPPGKRLLLLHSR